MAPLKFFVDFRHKKRRGTPGKESGAPLIFLVITSLPHSHHLLILPSVPSPCLPEHHGRLNHTFFLDAGLVDGPLQQLQIVRAEKVPVFSNHAPAATKLWQPVRVPPVLRETVAGGASPPLGLVALICNFTFPVGLPELLCSF